MELVETQPSAAPNLLQGLNRLPVLRQFGLIALLALSITLGVAVVMWSQTPAYSLLYANVAASEATGVLDALQNAGVPFRLDPDSGAILVPSSQVHEARIKLAAQGMPRSTDMGFELLEQSRSFGTSQFVERARYQRALEVELARSIATLNNVQAARVHLAVPRQSAFVRDRKPPSASVLVSLYAGRQLEPGQAGAIAHLVAAAIPNLEPESVRVIDEKGRLLSDPSPADHLGLTRNQLEYTQELEAAYIERIENILTPVLGIDNMKAQVVADVDFTRTEQTRESYNPEMTALRSEQRVEESSAGGGDGGVPGALTNQPPGAGRAPEVAGEGGAGGAGQGSSSSRRRETRNFEVEKTISHIQAPTGTVRRLSVAVVVDDKVSVGDDGKPLRTPLAPEEMERITALVKEAIGFDAERGDSVNVLNQSFTPARAIEPLPDPPFWKQPWLQDLAKQVGGVLLVLAVVFGLLRPMARNLVVREVTERELEEARRAGQRGDADGVADDQLSLGQGGAKALPRGPSYTQNLDTVRGLISEDPRRVANVVRNWVAQDG